MKRINSRLINRIVFTFAVYWLWYYLMHLKFNLSGGVDFASLFRELFHGEVLLFAMSVGSAAKPYDSNSTSKYT